MNAVKLLLYYPEWGNRWIPYFERELSRYDLTVFNAPATGVFPIADLEKASSEADVLISMWYDNVVGYWTKHFKDKKIISYCRRYEVWSTSFADAIDMKQVDAMIFVSEYYRKKFCQLYGTPKRHYMIPNGVDIKDFSFREEPVYSGKIAMVCSIKDVKNMALAVEILSMLPRGFSIHHIGIPFNDMMAGQLMSYIDYRRLNDRFKFEGSVKREEVSGWLEDKEIILSTSINEGNPNNVIEAMARGIKPVINLWPGALEQFSRMWVYETAQQAVDMIMDRASYTPESYRDWVGARYSLDNLKQIHGVIEDVLSS